MITPELRQAVEDILSDGAFRSRVGLSGFGPAERDQLDTVVSQVSGILQDRSLQAAGQNALWLNGASVVNGTITADKLVVNTLEAVTTNTGSLNVTGDIVAAASFPATGARVEINSDGLWGYSGAATTTFKLNVDGSGEIGTGSNKISWNTSGVLTVPVAIISSLTIAEVGSGVLGGTYQSSAATTRFELSSTSLRALASGTETFKIDASTGAVTMTGSFTVLSSATGAHVKIDNAGGIAGYNATSEIAGNRTFLLNAATGEGHLGISGITWTSGGSVSIPGSLLVNGTVTAGKLSVSTLSAITADLGTITAGTINGGTISATTITTGTLSAARISGGSVGGDFTLGSSDITVDSTGKIFFGGGSDYLGSDLLHFELSETSSDTIEWVRSTNVRRSKIAGYIQTSGSDVSLLDISSYNTGNSSDYARLQLFIVESTSSVASLNARATSSSHDPSITITATASDSSIAFRTAAATIFTLNETQLLAARAFYPGNSGSTQTSRHLSDNGSNLLMTTDTLHVTGGAGVAGIRWDNIANGGSATNWSGFSVANVPNTSAGYIKINIAGTNYRVPIYADG